LIRHRLAQGDPMTTAQRRWIAPTAALRTLLLTLITLALALPLHPSLAAKAAPHHEPTAPFATTIIVDTIADLNTTSQTTTTCTYDQGAFFNPAVDGCTLRRAILEASARPAAD